MSFVPRVERVSRCRPIYTYRQRQEKSGERVFEITGLGVLARDWPVAIILRYLMQKNGGSEVGLWRLLLRVKLHTPCISVGLSRGLS